MPAISIIIPTYNREHLIGRAVASVLTQEVDDYEVIIVDDASTDNTEKIVRNFSDTRIRYLRHPKNQGGSAARNTGIKNATGDYIAFLDSDDEWLPTKLTKQLAVFAKAAPDLGVVYTRYSKIDWKAQPEEQLHRGDISSHILMGNFVGTTSTVMVRRECFTELGGFDATLPSCQDWDMWIRIAQRYTFECIDEILVHYYHQQDSISMNTTASVQGHLMLQKKYKTKMESLPRSSRSQYYFNLGKNFWFKKNRFGSWINFIRAIVLDLSSLPRVIDFLFIRTGKKILKKIS